MKAYVLHGIKDLCLEERGDCEPGEEEAVVSVKATGICGSDIPRIYRTGTYIYPLIPGHEFSGVIQKTGKGVDPALKGKKTGVFPLLPCGHCRYCLEEQYELCQNYGYLGSRNDGGFAEQVLVPAFNLLPLPEEVSLEAAALLEPMAVAVHAIRRQPLKAGDTAAVCGLGTIGLMTLLFLLEMGITDVYVMGNKEIQRQAALQLGLPESRYCDIRKKEPERFLMERTKRLGVQVFFDCVGKNEILEQAIRCTAPGGGIRLVGNPSSDRYLDKNVYWKILRNQLTLSGTWNSSFTHREKDDWHYVLNRLKEKRIRPELLISHRLDFADLESGLRMMRDRTEEYIKILCVRQADNLETPGNDWRS